MPSRVTVPALAAIALVACSSSEPSQASLGPSSSDPNIVFADDFESGSVDLWQDGVDPSRHRVVSDPNGAQSGTHYLATTFTSGEDGGWLTTFLPPGHDALRASYYVRFPSGWAGAPKLIGFYGSRSDDQWSGFGKAGMCPRGDDFFSAMLTTEAPGDPGTTRFYTYYPAMSREPDGTTCWGRYGDGSERYETLAPLEPNRWHHIEFEVHLNTPGQKNARQDFWIDGDHRGSWSGFEFGDTTVLRLNAVQLSFNMSSGSPRTQQLHVDNVVVRKVP